MARSTAEAGGAATMMRRLAVAMAAQAKALVVIAVARFSQILPARARRQMLAHRRVAWTVIADCLGLMARPTLAQSLRLLLALHPAVMMMTILLGAPQGEESEGGDAPGESKMRMRMGQAQAQVPAPMLTASLGTREQRCWSRLRHEENGSARSRLLPLRLCQATLLFRRSCGRDRRRLRVRAERPPLHSDLHKHRARHKTAAAAVLVVATVAAARPTVQLTGLTWATMFLPSRPRPEV